MRQFEGVYTAKRYKNDNGYTYPLFIEANSLKEAEQSIKQTLSIAQKEHGWYGVIDLRINERV